VYIHLVARSPKWDLIIHFYIHTTSGRSPKWDLRLIIFFAGQEGNHTAGRNMAFH
jgi:hypothetical protein